MVLGKIWESEKLKTIAEEALSTMPRDSMILNIQRTNVVSFQAPREAVHFPDTADPSEFQWVGINSEAALRAIANCHNVQNATGLETGVLMDRFSTRWSVDAILKDSFDSRTSAFENSLRGDGVSPLLKISPALMHDNMSLHSLARSARAVGVTDLREALEGRSSMSNPALAAPSFSTVDHASSVNGDRSKNHFMPRTKRLAPSGTREVRDVLNRLGIGKQNTNLLKASFPALQKSIQKVPPYKV